MAPVDLVHARLNQHFLPASPRPTQSPTPNPQRPMLSQQLKQPDLHHYRAQALHPTMTSPPIPRGPLSIQAGGRYPSNESKQLPSSVQLALVLPNQLRSGKKHVAQRWRQHIDLFKRLELNTQIYLRMEAFHEIDREREIKPNEYTLLQAIEDLQLNLLELMEADVLIPAHTRFDNKGPNEMFQTFCTFLFAYHASLTVRRHDVLAEQSQTSAHQEKI